LQRIIHYEIDRIGKEVKIYSKCGGKYMNVHLQQCSGNKIFFVVPIKSVYNLPGVVFFDEDGKKMSLQSTKKMNKAYVLLAIAERVQAAQEFGITINSEDIKNCEKFWYNQIKTDGSFHFRTTGKIFSLGYGPKYNIVQGTNMSIAEFAQKKRKFTEIQIAARDKLRSKMFRFLHCSIYHIFATFDKLQETISPHIAILQNHFDLYDEEDEDAHNLQNLGILNVHLCHNAQTELKHTECDASYTIISVPDQKNKVSGKGKHNIAKFEFNLTNEKAIMIPLEVNTILVYSGFLLTHRQQIRNLNDGVDPFVNVVSYNSEKLFNHLMESFRREINEESRRK